ncbi:MAG: NAD(P)-dependent oxidoreductase [Syntrophales bacterium]
MAAAKAVFISRKLVPELWKVVLAEAPAGWTVDCVSPNDGEAEVARAIADAGYIVTFGSGRVPFELFEPLKQLRIVQTTGQGTDHLPINQLWEKGVFVCNTGGGNARSVAEFTLLLILATLRRLQPLAASLRADTWVGNSTMMNTHELYGKTLGIVGFGNIGKRVAHLAYGFGANIIFHRKREIPDATDADLHARQVSLEELLATADIVTLHVPSTEASRNLITGKQLSLMKPTSYIINTSRGAVINEADLISALHEKRIAGAGIDVWEQEPPDPDNPLLHLDNVVATPHAGTLAWENWQPRVRVIWDNLVKVSEGKEPLNQVREV